MDKISGGTHIFFAIDISITWDHCSSVQNKFKKEQFITSIVAPYVIESMYCSLTNKCTFY